MNRPKSIDKNEFLAKIKHLKEFIEPLKYKSLYLESEGALRWLTGYRHQVIDIESSAPTTLQAVVNPFSKTLTFFSDRWEEARIRSIMAKGIWNECGFKSEYQQKGDFLEKNSPLIPNEEQLRSIVSPLAEGFDGNQWRKLQWLINESRQALITVGGQLRSGQTGWDVRTMIYNEYSRRHIELNLVMVALGGMEDHLHPVVDDDSLVTPKSVVKLVVGARYYDMFHSASQLVVIDREPTEIEKKVHHALVEATLAYADGYRAGAIESDLYRSVGPIFEKIEKKYHLLGFHKGAYLHHLGGPLSPLGNRDFTLTEGQKRVILPFAQFALNPCEPIHSFKFEMQGVALKDQSPTILNDFQWCNDPSLYEVHLFDNKEIPLCTLIENRRV